MPTRVLRTRGAAEYLGLSASTLEMLSGVSTIPPMIISSAPTKPVVSVTSNTVPIDASVRTVVVAPAVVALARTVIPDPTKIGIAVFPSSSSRSASEKSS